MGDTEEEGKDVRDDVRGKSTASMQSSKDPSMLAAAGTLPASRGVPTTPGCPSLKRLQHVVSATTLLHEVYPPASTSSGKASRLRSTREQYRGSVYCLQMQGLCLT